MTTTLEKERQMAGEADITAAEVYRRVGDLIATTNQRFGDLERRVDSGFKDANTRISNMNVVHVDRYEADRTAQREREEGQDREIAELRNTNKWLSRLLVATALALVANVIGAGVVFIIGGL